MSSSKDSSSGCATVFVYAFVMIIWFVAFLRGDLVQPEFSKQLLASKQYTKIEILGYGWWRCGAGDVFSTRFRAVNGFGGKEQGTVCNGFLKTATIRYELPD